MNRFLFILRNLSRNAFRSSVIFISSALMAGFLVSSNMVIGGAQRSLQLALDRLGADIIVVPQESRADMENAFLMGQPASMWMSREILTGIASIPGVEVVSPQLYLSTLRGATCCSAPEMFLVAYDPTTDFTLRPWLESHHLNSLNMGEAIGGTYVYLPEGQDKILVYGYQIDLRGNLEPTGTGLDRTMFFTFDSAFEISRLSPFQAMQPMQIPPDSISSALIKLSLGSNPTAVASQIRTMYPEVTPVVSTNLFQSQRTEITGLLRSISLMLGIAWLLSIALIGLVFSIAINERRREIGVLRALGSTRSGTLKSLLAEGLLLAASGGAVGSLIFALAVYLFRNLIISTLGLPFLLPSVFSLLGLSLLGLGMALGSVMLGALFPALRISYMDPAVAMRE